MNGTYVIVRTAPLRSLGSQHNSQTLAHPCDTHRLLLSQHPHFAEELRMESRVHGESSRGHVWEGEKHVEDDAGRYGVQGR